MFVQPDGPPWGMYVAMIVSAVFFWSVVAALVVWAVRSHRRDRVPFAEPRGGTGSRAEEVLAERFARGEIDEQEYTHRRAVLRGGAG